MSFFEKLMKDAAPKAETIKNATINVSNKLGNSKLINASKNIGYKGLVNTVGIGMVLAKPAVEKAKSLATSTWSKVEELAADPK